MKTFTGFSKDWKLLLLIFPMVGSFAQAQVTIDVPQSIKTFQVEQASADSVIVVYRDEAGIAKKGAKGKSYSSLETPRKVMKSAARAKKGATGLSKAAKNLENMYAAKVRKGVSVETAVAEAQQDPDVLYAEPNWKVQVFSAPNDPYYENLYTLNNTGQVVKSLTTTGLYDRVGTVDADMDWYEAWTNADFPTNEVLVAVIDTGVDYTHPDITNRMWRNPGEIAGNGIDDDGNDIIDDVFGADFINGDGDPKDDNGHGTHCAGTIAAEGNNSLGIIGVNPYARIMAVKFLSAAGGGDTADAIDCIHYAVNNGAQILNNSWGGGAWSQAMQDAVDYATENGVVFVAAAGNSNSSVPSYPAAYNGVIAVASLDCNDKKSGFSNYGSWVDIAAHGSDILSLRADGTSLASQYVYQTNYLVLQGTSMACPNGVGALSLLLSAYPGRSPFIYERVLELTADTSIYNIYPNDTYYDGLLGSGRVNINRMLHDEVSVGYLDARWAGPISDTRVGDTNVLLVSAGIWSTPMNNLNITASNLTSGISLSTNLYTIGALPAFGSVDVPSNMFVMTVSPNATNEIESLRLTLREGTNVLQSLIYYVYLFQGNATWLAVDDLEGDGTNDLAVTYASYIMRYDNSGKMLWYHEPIIGEGIQAFTTVATGDVDGDGKKEIVALAENFFAVVAPPSIHVYRHDGVLVEGWPVEDYNNFTEPALADVDEDGADEIITVTGKGSGTAPVLKVFKGDGSVLWSKPLAHGQAEPVSVGDFDGDGYPEIAVCSFDNVWYLPDAATVYIVDGDGTTLAEWTVPDGYTIMANPGGQYAPIALGDLDGDTLPEIVLVGMKDGLNTTNSLFAWHADGSPVAGWPKPLKDTFRFYDTPVLADINGDAKPEVFTTHYFNEIEGFNPDGTTLTNFPVAYTNGYPTLQIDDLDGDSSADLLLRGFQTCADKLYAIHATNGQPVAGWYPYVTDDDDQVGISDYVFCNLNFNANRHLALAVGTKVYIIDTGYAYHPMERGWPMHRQNPQRTGLCDVNTGALFRCSFDTAQQYGISNLTATFTAYPVGFDATNSWYSWDFDDNGTPEITVFGVSTAAYTYASIGDYTVSLTVSNAAGKTFTRTRENYIHVLAPVVADFTVNIQTAEAPISLQFTDLSQNTPTRWLWDFGDYNTSTNQNPEHYYTDSGTYTVTLTVQNDFGTNGSSSNTIVKTAFITLTNDASTAIKYVSPSGLGIYPYKNWREAATNLQDAIDAALGGQTVLVTNGLYDCDNAPDLEYTIERNNITLRSVNGPEATVIHGRGLEYGNYFSALYINGATGTVVGGFTLEQGTYSQGGGISCEEADRTRIENCIFRDNSSAEAGASGGYGGGMWATRSVTIRNCLFERNAAYRGAALFLVTDSLTQTALVENCVFRDNGGDFRSQLGAAIAVDGTSVGRHIVRNCQITGNTGGYSIVYSQPAIEIDGCTIADNRTMYSGSGILQTHNDKHGEALNATSGTWTVRNTILAPNEGAAFYTNSGPVISFSYSCFTSTVAGTGNIVADPAFVSLPGDYHLSPASPCRDAGQNQSWMSSTNDLYGDSPRIVNTTVDMGCDEFVLGALVSAAPVSGAPPLDVSFTSTVVSVFGSVTNYVWTFGDGAVSNGASLTAVHHIYTNELGDFIAVLTVQDSAGTSASNGVRIVVDSVGPHLTNAQAVSSTKVELKWDEVVTASTATNLANYSVLSGFAVLDAEFGADSRSVLLTVTPAFTAGTTNQVEVSGVQDIYGNVISGVQTQNFIYVDAATYGILFDFGFNTVQTTGNWNNVTTHLTTGQKVTNAVDGAGNITEADLWLTAPFSGTFNGVDATNLYPSTAQRDCFYTYQTTAVVQIRQLNPDVRYDMTIFASQNNTLYSNTSYGAYSVGGVTNLLDGYLNVSNTTTFYSLVPDTNGTIELKVTGRYSTDKGYLNVLEIRQGSPILLLSTNRVVIDENTTAQLKAHLSVKPGNAITVSVASVSGDLDIQVTSASSIVFTPLNWEQDQTVSIRAGLDPDWLNGTATVQFVSAEMPAVEITCIEADRDINPAHLLPFSETFEDESPMAGTSGSVHDQHGWESAGSGAIVQSAVKHGGAQALEISNEEVWHPFVTTADVVNVSFYAIPQYREEPDSTVSNVAVYFYAATNGHMIACSNTTPVELSIAVSDSTWSLFEIECDYAAQTWNLRVNGTNAASGFGFYSAQSGLTRLELREGSETTSYLDDVTIEVAPAGDDADADGLPDSWEEFYYGNNAPSPSDLCANGVNTVREAYIAGFDPTDANAGFGISNVRNVLWWNAASGRVYTVYWSSNLLSGFNEVLHSNVTGGAFTDTLHSAEQKGFYRLEVQLAP